MEKLQKGPWFFGDLFFQSDRMQKTNTKKAVRPARQQSVQPGLEEVMDPSPVFEKANEKKGIYLTGQILHPNGGEIVNG